MRLLALLLALSVSTAGATEIATLREVRPILAPDQTRLIFETGRAVRFEIKTRPADKETGTPPRLYVDLFDTRVRPAALVLAPREGPLTRLRATQLKGNVTRLILDVPGLAKHAAFPLADPFRLVIDVHGDPRVAPRAKSDGRPLRTAAVKLRPTVIPLRAETIAAVRASLRLDQAAISLPAAKRFRVVLDPGHGGKDPGAIGPGGVVEKDVVLSVAKQLAKRLQASGYGVILTRDSDMFKPLSERTRLANAAEADLFVSIHANASHNRSASGIETYYLSNTNDRATMRLAHMENQLLNMTGQPPADSDVSWIVSDMIQSYKVEESHELANQVQAALVREARRARRDVRDLGAKPGPFYVLVGAAMPAVLAEVAFVSHPEEGRRLQDESYQERLVEGLLRGIGSFVENKAVAATL